MVLTDKQIKEFQTLIWNYYNANKRSFPWRETYDPYHILVSELMLQQTQTIRVLPKYEKFIETFPNVKSLAEATQGQVLQLWQGLGYNRRALFLHQAAKQTSSNRAGVFPNTTKELTALPGIGDYTAKAIAVFAFEQTHTLIETNIRTVFIHTLFKDTAYVSDKELLPLIADTMDASNPREWYYALMDYGVFLKQTLPNPSRRSKHHQKQSTFKGSFRQVRGAIIRELSQKAQSLHKLQKNIQTTDEYLQKALQDLTKEGFLAEKRGVYTIKD